jgi:hypothetical protein
MSTGTIAFCVSQLGVWTGLVGIILRGLGRITVKDFFLMFALSSLLELIAAWMVLRWMVPVDAALAVFNLWLWWNNGGDDDTKKRLRKLKKKFQPVRRMAPVTA